LFSQKIFKLYKFKILSKYTEKKVVALGGISKKNIKQIKLTNASSIAGISYFEQKKGP
jgi:thiamine-phosphate pyrophosphorylase